MTFRRDDLGTQTNFAAMLGQPVGAAFQVFFVPRLRGDTRKSKVFKKLLEKTLLVGLEIINDALHARKLSGSYLNTQPAFETKSHSAGVKALQVPAGSSPR